MWMNRFDIEDAVRTFDRTDTPNLYTGAVTLHCLMTWADANSDGWVYWPKPSRAARALMTLLDDAKNTRSGDITQAELTKAIRPIKAFLTRSGADHAVVLHPGKVTA